MYKRLRSILNKHKILYNYQFDFYLHGINRNYWQHITNDPAKGKYIARLFLDMNKAFYTVDHSVLFTKVNHCGIRREALSWFDNY